MAHVDSVGGIPRHFVCPITLNIMEDPVIAGDGHTYERHAIQEWIRRRGQSPITKAPVSTSSLIPNYNLKSQIDEFQRTQ